MPAIRRPPAKKKNRSIRRSILYSVAYDLRRRHRTLTLYDGPNVASIELSKPMARQMANYLTRIVKPD